MLTTTSPRMLGTNTTAVPICRGYPGTVSTKAEYYDRKCFGNIRWAMNAEASLVCIALKDPWNQRASRTIVVFTRMRHIIHRFPILQW